MSRLEGNKKTNTKEIQMNTSSNLLVLGVTGQVGKLVAKNLRRSDAQFSVGTRRKANLEVLADQFGASRFIDLDDPRTFDEALKNVTGIFLITGYTVDMLVQSKSLIDAAKRNGVNHIVHLGVEVGGRSLPHNRVELSPDHGLPGSVDVGGGFRKKNSLARRAGGVK